jgi:hypothetical protein
VAKELAKERDDIKITETSTASNKGKRRADHYNIRSVPTLFVTSPNYPDRIGHIGTPSKKALNKMVNIALGIEDWEKQEGLFSHLIKKIKQVI